MPLPRSTGKVLAVRGAVVDIAFDAADLPPLDEALIVEWDRPESLIVEVQAHLDERTVRGLRFKPLPVCGAACWCAQPEIRSRCRSETRCSAGFSMSPEMFATAARRCRPICRARQSIERRHRSGTAVLRRRYSKPASK